jgi:hypothetical protein
VYVVLVSSISSTILDPLLIFGIGPFPMLGIKGAAWAAVIAQSFAFLFSIYFLQIKSSRYELKQQYLIPDLSVIKSIYSTGFPSVVTNSIISLVLIIYNHILAHFGSLAIAALGICFRVNGLVTMILFGIGFGLIADCRLQFRCKALYSPSGICVSFFKGVYLCCRNFLIPSDCIHATYRRPIHKRSRINRHSCSRIKDLSFRAHY